VREPQSVPERLQLTDGSGGPVELVPFHAGETLSWRIAD
jgi:dihydroorotase